MYEEDKQQLASAHSLLSNGHLYQMLIEENRHLHQVWIDNFRVVITFNSIFLAGIFAVLTILGKGESTDSFSFVITWFLRSASVIGTVVTLVGMHIIRTTKAITSLRLKEIRYLEDHFGFDVPIFPFEEGAYILNRPKTMSFINDTRKPPYELDKLRLNLISGLSGYIFIGASFLGAYVLIFLLSFINIGQI